jgi:hypothetical protein
MITSGRMRTPKEIVMMIEGQQKDIGLANHVITKLTDPNDILRLSVDDLVLVNNSYELLDSIGQRLTPQQAIVKTKFHALIEDCRRLVDLSDEFIDPNLIRIVGFLRFTETRLTPFQLDALTGKTRQRKF